MIFTRINPSPRYQELIGHYRTLHAEGEKFLGQSADDTFAGVSLRPHAHHIKRLVERTGAASILDYGSGKGRQYELRKLKLPTGDVVESIVDYWSVDSVRCYDPSYAKHAALPQDRFDGVISTDVLEHCPEEDLPWIIGEMFAFARRFVYANVACYPARKRLPSGENAHCTVRPPGWWADLVGPLAQAFPDVYWELAAHTLETGPEGERHIERRFVPAMVQTPAEDLSRR